MKILDYVTPKSMVYSGKVKQKETVINHYHYNEKEVIVSHDFTQKEGYKSYIQVVGLNDTERINQLQVLFSINEFIFEDIYNVSQREKVEVKEDYIFSVLHALFYQDDIFKKEYLSMICLDNVVISFHEDNPWFLEPTIKTLESYQDLRVKSSGFLFYHIMDLITDNHIDVFDKLNMVINEFEDVTLNGHTLPQEDFYKARKAFVRLKNNVYYLLEALNTLIPQKHKVIDEIIEFYNDLVDHLSRLDGQINLARENVRNLVDVNMNNQSNRMNQIMTTLTLFSAIFIPLSFLTGFFGMNFIYFDILRYEHAVIAFVGFCLLLIGFMIWFFKHKKWL